jgi:SPP1 gp7 family putative phage head morphogenesis protein
MALPNGTPVNPSMISRAIAGLRYAWTGSTPGEWFSPLQPIPPAQDQAQAQQSGVAGRQFDFAAGYNVNTRPRSNERVSFETLRAMADNFDLLRLVIETRKDQVTEMPWQVVPRDKKKKPDQRCEEAQKILRKPDGEHSWDTWLRLLLEDLFVLDAPTIYVRPNLGGDAMYFEPIDGATIKRVIDSTGRTPVEGPAYQQILKGVPAVDYTRDELIYRPRNPRTNRVYGLGPVEQVINTVNVALRRNQFVLDYFTSGTVPDALAGVPETWSVDQIGMFQKYWDNLLVSEDGDSSLRRKLRFVPGEIARNFKETKAPPLKDMFDEWLARIVCYCFSIDVTPFVAQVNRSVAETNREQSLMEGLGPIMRWTKGIADEILERTGFEDLEMSWQEGKIVDPEKRMKVLTGYVEKKVLHPDEAREELGRDPLTDAQKKDMNPPAPVMEPGEGPPGGPPGSRQDSPEDQEEGPGLGKAQRPAISGRPRKSKLVAAIKTFLDKKRAEYTKILAESLDLAKADGKGKASVDDLDWSEWSELADEVQPMLVQMAVAASEEAVKQVGGNLADAAMANMRKKAEDWASQRSAEMVGMRRVGDMLIPNPNAVWQITETTRDALRSLTEQALDEGWSTQKFADAMQEAHAFSDDRAENIARTELAKADSAGTLNGFKSSGVVTGKWWQTAEDDKVSDICTANAESGIIPLDAVFPSGDEAPPGHPKCRCVIVPSFINLVNQD